MNLVLYRVLEYLQSLFPTFSLTMPLETLPSEILLQIVSYLTPIDITNISLVCRRFHTLSLDTTLWKNLCFEDSHANRKRLHHLNLANSDRRYAPLLQAMLDLQGARHLDIPANTSHASAEMERARRRGKERLRTLANWDPIFPGERIDWREEYVQRHAEVAVSWFEGVGGAQPKDSRREAPGEVTGAAILYTEDGAVADKLVCAMDDGSVCIWEIEEHGTRGQILARSKPGLLTGSSSKDEEHDIERTKAIMTEIGAVECVSVDSITQRAYFGVLNELVEVDLRLLKVTSREKYPFAVTALSEARFPTPMTVGTNMTLHMYDPRDARRKSSSVSTRSAVKVELIGGEPRLSFPELQGSPRSSHATLAQPGPLSILHLLEDRAWDGNGSIWVSGRFTSLLNYDRRFFPKLRGSLHSGARISCLRSLPNPFLPRELSLMSTNTMTASAIAEAKAIPGTTLLAAGEYKGKGSLEMYGLSPDPTRTCLSTDHSGSRARAGNNSFLNRQTASSSKLLSVAQHGGKVVFSDGDGNLRWVERDGFSPVRVWNINGHDPNIVSNHIFANGIFSLPTRDTPEDIVQLLLPTRPKATTIPTARFGEDNLIMWTGEGKLGLVSFGKPKWELSQLEDDAEKFEDRVKRSEERNYDAEMGSLLRAHANELNFMADLGIGNNFR